MPRKYAPRPVLTHCRLRGHEFTEENTYYNAGRRTCRACVLLRDRAKQSPRPNWVERWIAKLEFPESSDCWLWTGSINRGGYGQWWDGQEYRLAHRFSYEVWVAPLTSEKPFACHTCDVRRCVYPGHLWAGTWRDNARDAWAKGRGKTAMATLASAKLTVEDVAALRSLNPTAPEEIVSIAKICGVHPSTLRRALRGETWDKVLHRAREEWGVTAFPEQLPGLT